MALTYRVSIVKRCKRRQKATSGQPYYVLSLTLGWRLPRSTGGRLGAALTSASDSGVSWAIESAAAVLSHTEPRELHE